MLVFNFILFIYLMTFLAYINQNSRKNKKTLQDTKKSWNAFINFDLNWTLCYVLMIRYRNIISLYVNKKNLLNL